MKCTLGNRHNSRIGLGKGVISGERERAERGVCAVVSVAEHPQHALWRAPPAMTAVVQLEEVGARTLTQVWRTASGKEPGQGRRAGAAHHGENILKRRKLRTPVWGGLARGAGLRSGPCRQCPSWMLFDRGSQVTSLCLGSRPDGERSEEIPHKRGWYFCRRAVKV